MQYHRFKAAGIPDRSEYGDPHTGLRPGQLARFVVQRHLADRAGEHFDYRVGDRERGLYSWASRKHPDESLFSAKPVGMFPQPVHSYDYADFEGEIKDGYGKGRVAKERDENVLVGRVDPDKILFSTSGKHPARFALIKDNRGNHLMRSVRTPERHRASKETFPETDESGLKKILESDPDAVVEPKVDGALNFLQMENGKPELLSHRVSRVTGKPVVHTERFFRGLPEWGNMPDDLKNIVLKAEVYGEGKDGSVIPPRELNSILNSGLAESLGKQDEKGVVLRAMLFDTDGRGKSRGERMETLERFRDSVPPEYRKRFVLPGQARGPSAGMELARRIREGKHPLTSEGVVVRPSSGRPSKVKNTSETDVYVRNVFPGKGRFGGGPGGFYYSLTPDGPVVGKVGTGFTDELRRNLAEYSGRTARVKSRGSHPSGALRDPRLVAFHEDYPGVGRSFRSLQKKSGRVSLSDMNIISGNDNPFVKESGIGSALLRGLKGTAGGVGTAGRKTMRPLVYDIDGNQSEINKWIMSGLPGSAATSAEYDFGINPVLDDIDDTNFTNRTFSTALNTIAFRGLGNSIAKKNLGPGLWGQGVLGFMSTPAVEGLDQSGELAKRIGESLNTWIDALNETGSRLNETAESMEEFPDVVSAYQDTLGRTREDIEHTSKNFRESSESVKNTAENVSVRSDELLGNANAFLNDSRSFMDDSASFMDDSASFMDDSTSFMDDFVESTDKLNEGFVESADKLNEGLVESADKLNEGFVKSTDKLNEGFGVLSSPLAKSIAGGGLGLLFSPVFTSKIHQKDTKEEMDKKRRWNSIVRTALVGSGFVGGALIPGMLSGETGSSRSSKTE